MSFDGFRLGLWSDHRFGAGLATCIPAAPVVLSEDGSTRLRDRVAGSCVHVESLYETSLLESLSSPGVVIAVPLLLVAAPSAR